MKKETMYSLFLNKNYRENFEENYKNMLVDIENGKFNLSTEDYIRIYDNTLEKSICEELIVDIDSSNNSIKFYDVLSNLLRSGTFINTHSTNNSFNKKIENTIESLIRSILPKYLDDVKPLYYSYGDSFNHYKYQVLKYDKNDFFKIHHDHYAETLNHSRLLTICTYLNEDYEGGELLFPSINKSFKFKTGQSIIFPSNWMFYHGVNPIFSGSRYTIVIWVGINLEDNSIIHYFGK